MKPAIGTYVKYKGNTYIVYGHSMGTTVKIMNLNNKTCVSVSNIEATNYKPAALQNFKGHKYIRTAKCNVISATTGNVMKKNSEQYREIMMWHL